MSEQTREVIYPEIEVRLMNGDSTLTCEDAKEFLGWVIPEEDGASFISEQTHFRDIAGRTVFCHNTTAFQRRWIKKSYNKLKWDILKGQFHFNGEPVIIGQTGFILDGKHRLAALVLAVEEWKRNPERYPYWKTEPHIDLIVVSGIEEDPSVANTIGTGITRSISDSLFASGFFEGHPKKEVVKMTRMLENAVRLLWSRTGAEYDAFSPTISHAEAFDFIDNHPYLIDCVKTVYTQNKEQDGTLQSFIPLGYLSAAMYLMATSDSTQEQLDVYKSSINPNQEQLTINEDTVDKYIYALAKKEETVGPILMAIADLFGQGINNSMESLGVLAKGWELFKHEQPITRKLVRLKTKVLDGIRHVEEDPTFGGIDLGIHVSEEN